MAVLAGDRQYFIHKNAIVESSSIGPGTRIWAFAHVLAGAVIGEQCNICDHTFIENDVTLGDRVTIKCGVQVWDGVTIEDDVFIGPNATFTNDGFPRSRQPPERYLRTVVKKGASIGANATVLPGLTIGEYSMIGAGAVATRNVPARAIVAGNPARIIGYEGVSPNANEAVCVPPVAPGATASSVDGVSLHRLPSAIDMRGSLSFAEVGRHLPFEVKRLFLVYGVPSKEVRGEHAHRQLHQFLLCVNGACSLIADNGRQRDEFILNDPGVGVHIPPLVWSIQYKHSADAVLLVLASDHYDPKDYIRDYSEFLRLIAR